MSNLAIVVPIERGSKIETPKTRVRSGTLASGITKKMAAFARHVAEGLSLADAYRRSFNTANMKSKTVRDDASRLAQHGGVRAAIEGYRAEIEAQNRIAALKQEDRIWASLWSLAEDEDIAPSVRVKALHLAAQLCGMFEKPEGDPALSTSSIEAELRDRLETYSLATRY